MPVTDGILVGATSSATNLFTSPNAAQHTVSGSWSGDLMHLGDAADLSLSATASISYDFFLRPYLNFTYTLRNNGQDYADGVLVNFNFPAGTTYYSMTVSQGDGAYSRWSAGTFVTSTGSVVSDMFDGFPLNNNASASITAP